MVRRSEQILVRVTPERKEEWREFADDESSSVDGMSDLVRRATTAYIENGGDPRAVGGDVSGDDGATTRGPDDLTERLAAIEDELSAVQSTVERVDESTNSIERMLSEEPAV